MTRKKHGDLTGKRFGRWVVLHKGERTPSGRVWYCRCDCGTERYVIAKSLYTGISKSCGCLHRELTSLASYEDLTGQRFGRFRVLYYDETCNSKKGRKWFCLCDCGTICSVVGSRLKSGESRSCGCYNKEQVSRATKIDLTGQIFGRWTVLRDAGRTKDQTVLWLCRCDCGTERVVRGQSLRSGRSKSCGCYKQERVTKHGLSDTIEYKVMQSRKHRERRRKIDSEWTIEHDNILREYMPYCAICGMTQEEHQESYEQALHIDHVLPIMNEDGSNGAPLCPGNAVVLCRSHNCSKRNYTLASLPLDWQVNIIWNAFMFKDHWDSLQDDFNV